MTPIKAQTPAPVALKVTPQEVDPPVPSTSEPASGHQTPPVAKVNGSDSTTSSTPGSAEKGDRGRDRSEKYKPKRRERKDHDRDRADKDTARDADAEGGSGEREDDAEATTTSPPKLDTSGSPAPGSDAGPQSPRTDSTGIHTPTSRKPNRNPWTLFVRLPNTANETELRDFFGEAKDGVRTLVYRLQPV